MVLNKSQKTVLTILEINTKLNMQCLHTITQMNLIRLKLFGLNDFKVSYMVAFEI